MTSTPSPSVPNDEAMTNLQGPVQVELVPLSQILPDRYQARLAIPPEHKEAFFAGEMDCYQVADRLLHYDEKTDPALYRMVGELRLLGQSILNDGQIEPATGRWIDAGGAPLFFLETGERRFWSLAVAAVELNLQEEPLLKVLPDPATSRQRQVAENLLREDLCAVEMGKMVATLILESLGVFPADGENEMHYYRKVLQIGRLPSRTWPELERVTGYSRPVLYRHYRLLSLPDDLLYLATLYRVSEFALREIVTAPPEKQREMIDAIIAEQSGSQAVSDPAEAASPVEGEHARPAASLTQKRAERLLLALRPLIKQSQADGGYKQIASELSALLEPDSRKVVAAAFRSMAQGMER